MTKIIKRACVAVLAASIAISSAFSLTACGDNKQGEPGKDGETPYIGENGNWWIGAVDTGVLAAAKSGTDGVNGADGQNGLDGKDGTNGVDGITPEFFYNEETGYLQISYDGGTSWNNLAHVGDMISEGSDGVDGVSISACTINDNGELVVEYSDGRSDNLGVIVAKNGSDGVGIETVTLDEEGNLSVTLTDGTELSLGNVNGLDGINGKDGIDGKDGITPELKIDNEDREWYVSYDGGKTWNPLGIIATGTDGSNGIDGTNGKNGNTPLIQIKGENNTWHVSYDNGDTWVDLGVSAIGEPGKNAITPLIKIENGEWMISRDNGSRWEHTGVMAEGTPGENGADGRGIEKMEIEDGYLYVTYTDSDKRVNIGKVSEDKIDGEELGEGEEGSGGSASSAVTDIYTDALEFYPLKDGSEYGVKIGKGIYLEKIVIPATYNGKPVTTILTNAFSIDDDDDKENKILKEVVIGENVTTIQANAFASCVAITSITVPKNVKVIGDNAFDTIPEVVFEITVDEIPAGENWDTRNIGIGNIVWSKKT